MNTLSKRDEAILKRLTTPNKVQDYLDSIPFNFEKEGETCMSPLSVLKYKKAHCLEGAMFAVWQLNKRGYKARILNLKVTQGKGDFDHAVALFQENGYWGAISKTNHNVLRYRDPIYKTIREIALSYFHEYFLTTDGTKTLRAYSRPIDLNRFGGDWATAKENLWDIGSYIFHAPHISIVPPQNKKYIRKAHRLERQAASIPEWEKS